MKRVLVLGGYGTLGSRIASRLAASGFEVMVAGRSQERAEAFCRGRAGMTPITLDREEVGERLTSLAPWAVVDAAGPFQGSDYRVARAAISAGAHYLDIADGRDFVAGIGALDEEARGAGVAAISGASSFPALSDAVVRHLGAGLDSISSVELSLSATSRGTAGTSVTRAILSYLGRPIRMRRGGRWSRGFGWQELERQDFTVSGRAPLSGRLVALADIPDLELLPERLPGRPAVSFKAGTDMALHNLGLWLLSWPVRWGWLKRVAKMAGLLSSLQRVTDWAASDRSAMRVRLFGVAGRNRLERRWTLIAEQGVGPELPGLAVPMLLNKLSAGAIGAGARDAGGLLALATSRPNSQPWPSPARASKPYGRRRSTNG